MKTFTKILIALVLMAGAISTKGGTLTNVSWDASGYLPEATGVTYGTNIVDLCNNYVSNNGLSTPGNPDTTMAKDALPFITQWVFPSGTSEIKFNALTVGAVNYTWTASPSGNNGNGNFTRAAAGPVTLGGMSIPAGDTLTLTMEAPNLQRFYISFGVQKDKLIDVVQ